MTQAIIFIVMLTDKGNELGPGNAEKDETCVLSRGVYTVVRISTYMYKKIAIKDVSCLIPGTFRE